MAGSDMGVLGHGTQTVKGYADEPTMRVRQLVSDTLVLVWSLLALRIALGASRTLVRLQEPTRGLRSAGDLLALGPGPVGDAGERLAEAGSKMHDGIGLHVADHRPLAS